MTHKTAYLWGPVSSFSGQLAAFLVQKGWHVHVATKGAFHVALSPLDLKSSAQDSIERAFGDRERYYMFEERIKYLDVNEHPRTTYDAVVFCGLPPNFDEPRSSRAPWAAENYGQIIKRFKGSSVFIVSSLWSAVQNDGVVPEEIECERRKPLTRWEAVAQSYENKLLKTLGSDESRWYLVRLPMISGATTDGRMIDFSGPMVLFDQLSQTVSEHGHNHSNTLSLQYNPDATLWFLPVDAAVHTFWRLLEDEQRPRITNLVSTQAMLNQEWLTHLAKALGYHRAAHVESDSYNLPVVLRRALSDNILVSTRGLFEVMGRYQQQPISLDNEYFARVLKFGCEHNWGRLAGSGKNGKCAELDKKGKTEVKAAQSVETNASTEDLARMYFTEFMPQNANSAAIREVVPEGSGIGFTVEQLNAGNLDWTLRAENGHAVMENTQDLSVSPKVRFYFTPSGFQRLVNRKVSLERALVMREARVEGSPIEILKACNFLKRFIKDHPYETAERKLHDAAAHKR